MAERFSMDIVYTPMPALVARGFFMAAERMRQLETPLTAATAIVAAEIQANFDAEGRPGRWEELKDSTVRRKQSEGLDPRILRATEALVEGAVTPGIWDINEEGRDWVATLADPTGYGWRHLEKHTFMPIRDWTFISDEAYDAIEEAFTDWINDDVLSAIGGV